MTEKLKVSAGTIVRTVVLVLALANQVLAALGKSPIPVDSEQLSALISTAATMAAAVWAWWKNNSFSKAALQGDAVMQAEKGNAA